jgi:hypothetical protein
VLDSRQNVGAFSATLNVNVTGSGCGVPGSAQAYVFNATVVPPSPLGYLTLWPEGAAQPLVSTLNAIDGALTSNMAIVPAANGSVSAYASNSTQLILDASGYFAPATVTGPISISFTQSAPNSDNAGGSFSIAASVSNDPGNGGVNWTVTCGSAQCGSFTLTHTANGSSTSYTAPSSVPAGGAVTITATAADSSSTQASAFVTINSSSIQVSFSQTPPTIIPVSTTANLYASVANDGSNAGVNWTVTCGSGTCGSFNSTHTASGAATVYTAPSSVPAGGNVTITATSTANNGRNAQATIAINPTALANGNLSGNVNGTWVAGLTITLTPSNGGSAINSLPTATNGAYSFSNLTGGTYNVSGSAGYSYSPAAITINGNAVQNITATPQIASYSISGSVSYAGSQTGVTYITVYPCTGCNPIGGTTLSSAPSAGGTPYTIRGLASSGNQQYFVGAQIDTQGTGVPNASDPAGNSSNFTLSSNLTGVNVGVTNQTPSAPQTPSSPSVFPASGAVFIAYSDPTDSNNNEIATSYKLYYGTDTNASNLTPVTIQAGNQNGLYILGGLTNGTQYYFKMSAVNSNAESTPSSISGPVTIGATTGSNTVSGTVTFTGTASGPLYIGVYSNSLGVYFERIPTPSSSPVAYSISGIPSGSYAIFAVLDQNADGTMDPGDVTNFTGFHGPQPIIVNGNVANETVALGAASGPNTVAATTFVATSHNAFSFTSDSYSVNVGINDGTKLPVSMTVFSGPNIAVPYDMTVSANNNEYSPIFNNTVSPNVGDTYQFMVTFSDGSTQVLSSTVTTVLSSFPQNLTMITTGTGTPTIPVLSWSAPAATPAALPYTYQVGLYGSNLVNENWGYSGHHDGGGIPSTTTSVLFNVDGSANPSSSLILGDTYNWYVGIQDANGNTAQYTTTYMPSN